MTNLDKNNPNLTGCLRFCLILTFDLQSSPQNFYPCGGVGVLEGGEEGVPLGVDLVYPPWVDCAILRSEVNEVNVVKTLNFCLFKMET